MIYAVLIAGGRGERFWPFSTKEYPKQLLRIFSNRSMLEETLARVEDLVPQDRVLLVTGENIKKKVLEDHASIDENNILAEPFGKNTCLAIGFAASHLLKTDPDATMIVLPADHYIKPKERLMEIFRYGTALAEREDMLITIGITPTRPETGYGYIELGEEYDSEGGLTSYKVRKFKEKPNRNLAQQYYVGRHHLWNSGMFIWSAKSILNAVNKCQPEMSEALDEYSEHIDTEKEMAARRELFEKAESVSIDIGVLESAENVVVIQGDIMWDDIGSWLALERISGRDKDNNVSLGNTLLHESYEITAVNSGDGIVATLGVSDLVIVRTSDVVLVAHKTKVNDIKDMLARMKDDAELSKYL
jgi:mannose-1-phosphate guanylyltransferase